MSIKKNPSQYKVAVSAPLHISGRICDSLFYKVLPDINYETFYLHISWDYSLEQPHWQLTHQ